MHEIVCAVCGNFGTKLFSGGKNVKPEKKFNYRKNNKIFRMVMGSLENSLDLR